MARTLYRLTDRIIRALAAPGYHADGGGLYLQISKAGTRSWVFRYSLRRRTRDMGLGSATLVSLTEARVKAGEARALVARGVDPIEKAKVDRVADEPAFQASAKSFQDFAEEYIAAREGIWRSAKHGAQWRATLAQYAFPKIGAIPLSGIDTPDVLRVLEPIWATKSETASRVRGRIERILAAAAVRGLRPATNPAAWVGHLREALPRKPKSTPFAALPYPEIPTFMTSLRNKGGVGARALEFAILGAARSGEVRGARWQEMDEAAATWTVPAERMKAGRPHIVPLSDRSLDILAELKPLRDLAAGYVFPGANGKTLSDGTLNKIVDDLGFNGTAHGMRACFKTWAEQETEHANVVIEAALAHIVGDKAEQSYMRGDWLQKRRALMRDWAAFCGSTPVENVVPLSERAA
jgi:integrase